MWTQVQQLNYKLLTPLLMVKCLLHAPNYNGFYSRTWKQSRWRSLQKLYWCQPFIPINIGVFWHLQALLRVVYRVQISIWGPQLWSSKTFELLFTFIFIVHVNWNCYYWFVRICNIICCVLFVCKLVCVLYVCEAFYVKNSLCAKMEDHGLGREGGVWDPIYSNIQG